MAFYKILFDKGFLERGDLNSPISLKGMEKLCEIYNAKYDFINTTIINEDEIVKELKTFNESFDKLKKENKVPISEDKKEFISENEEQLLEEIKNFNREFEITPDKTLFTAERLKRCSLIIKQLGLDKISSRIPDLICKIVFKRQKNAKLNFYVWVGEHHYSLVCNIRTYFFFLDSCSTFFKRWPSNNIISFFHNDNLFNTFKTLVMKSFLQKDDFNCGSYAFSFIDEIINLYQEYDFDKPGNIISYFLKYFTSFSKKEGFLTESTSISANKNTEFNMNMNLYLLPKEILYLCQDKDLLDSLKVRLNLKYGDNNDYSLFIETIRNEQKQNNYAISRRRQEHLKLLSEA